MISLDIAHATRIAPEFLVIFDVDYLDTELGLRLAALGAAVRNGDRMGVSSAAKVLLMPHLTLMPDRLSIRSSSAVLIWRRKTRSCKKLLLPLKLKLQ